MTTNPYAPGTKSHAVAAAILDAHARGQWEAIRTLRASTGAGRHLIAAVRARLRDDGLIGIKRDYVATACRICGAPPIARGLCGRHYRPSRTNYAVFALALILALPGYPGRWLVLADAEPAVTGGVALCAGGEWPQWCVVQGRGDVAIDGVQVQWVVRLPGVSR